MKAINILTILVATLLAACGQSQTQSTKESNIQNAKYEVVKTPQEWKNILSDQEYYVLRESGTERAFTGAYWNHKENGVYTCKGCGTHLFESDTKFKSGTGWPSYYDVVSKENVELVSDKSLGMTRSEVRCGKCGGHLGHVFDDGPAPTGLRYCINSASLGFKKK
jgi:peptide-methionine (R)-S-oxide reductase